ncbi:hypothetical protein TVAGG3_0834970 [Trichomonas vaginalis G3]|uniref:hypothetical protein n=1 Tax=Trichomonas vaginalis (strain ATCC PRA-98 / G3) TaxID=412133 RepID=UPI0021E54479|nr:hypothetical protein TVAGG3_0834970 [Trichomonas vaginalis G3]KAI5498844.1 hypothetical protein TVAGG3_0834970 [Trichomonas vaginalis G3]
MFFHVKESRYFVFTNLVRLDGIDLDEEEGKKIKWPLICGDVSYGISDLKDLVILSFYNTLFPDQYLNPDQYSNILYMLHLFALIKKRNHLFHC